jgi:hypothetical protein
LPTQVIDGPYPTPVLPCRALFTELKYVFTNWLEMNADWVMKGVDES